MSQRATITDLREFHDDVDRATTALELRHATRLTCTRGCSKCCVDELTVFEAEAERIRETHPELLRDGTPRAPGACAFLDDEGACRIYEDRPYVCRTQGLPLRWTERADDTVLEYRDICPLNDDRSDPIEALDERDCWTIGPWESRLLTLESRRSSGQVSRVPLRDLFHKK